MAGMRSSYYPNYFSLEDILASEERIPVEVKEDLADLGFLDPGADLKELKRGTKLELPQWMVEGLNTGRSPYLDVEVLLPLISTFSHYFLFYCWRSGAKDLPRGVP